MSTAVNIDSLKLGAAFGNRDSNYNGPGNGHSIDMEKRRNSNPDTTPPGNSIMLKYSSLVALTLQNSLVILLLRYVRTREGDMFLASTAVICSEFVKLITSVLLVFVQERSLKGGFRYLYDNTIGQPLDCVKVSLPSLIYVVQNNLLFLAVSNLDAATYQVTYQLKILTTALFSVGMLGKRLSRMQWLALVILFLGVSIVQLQPDEKDKKPPTHEGTDLPPVQRPIIGLLAVIMSCFLSGFAGVYFEKILKGTKQSIWLRNVQLAFLGVIIGFITMGIKDSHKLSEKGFFHGYDFFVVLAFSLQAFGGLMVALVIKYADNILKGFATSASIVLSCIASIFLFEFHLSIQFSLGAGFVIIAVYMYSKFVPQPVNKQ